MSNTSTNDMRDDRAMAHSAQRSKNPNHSRAIRMNPVNAPTTYDHNTGRDDSDMYSKKFIHTGVAKQHSRTDYMSARRLAQKLMGSGA